MAKKDGEVQEESPDAQRRMAFKAEVVRLLLTDEDVRAALLSAMGTLPDPARVESPDGITVVDMVLKKIDDRKYVTAYDLKRDAFRRPIPGVHVNT